MRHHPLEASILNYNYWQKSFISRLKCNPNCSLLSCRDQLQRELLNEGIKASPIGRYAIYGSFLSVFKKHKKNAEMFVRILLKRMISP